MDDYDKELTEKEIEKAAEISTKKKGGKGAAIGMVFFALVAIGLGVWVAILLMTPKESCSKGGNTASGGSSEVVETDDFRKSVADVQNLLDEIGNSLGGTNYSFEHLRSTGLLTKINDNLWTTTGLDFGTKITAYGNNASTMRNNAVAVLKKHNMTNTTVTALWPGQESDDTTHYFKNDDGLYCVISDVEKYNGKDSFSYRCSYYAWLSDQDKELIIALAEAYKQSEMGKQYGDVGYIEGFTRSIHKSPSGNYEKIAVSFSDSVGYFYRKVGDDWKFFTATQQGINCDLYNTDELKEAFEGDVCWGSKGNDVTIKR